MEDDKQSRPLGLKVLERNLAEVERPKLFRDPERSVPRELIPRADQVVILHRRAGGLRDLEWGEPPDPKDPRWLEAYKATVLQRACRERMVLRPPSRSGDLDFTVTVEWNCELKDPMTFLEATGNAASSAYHDEIERVTRNLAKRFDPRAQDGFEEELTELIRSRMRVRRTRIPGVEVTFGRVQVQSPEAALVHHQSRRTARWKDEEAEEDHELGSRVHRRRREQLKAERATDLIEVETESSVALARTEADNENRLRVREGDGEVEQATDRIVARQAGRRRDDITADARAYGEILAGEHGPAALGMALGDLSPEKVFVASVQDARLKVGRFYALLQWLINNDSTNEIDLGDAGRQLVMRELAELSGMVVDQSDGTGKRQGNADVIDVSLDAVSSGSGRHDPLDDYDEPDDDPAADDEPRRNDDPPAPEAAVDDENGAEPDEQVRPDGHADPDRTNGAEPT